MIRQALGAFCILTGRLEGVYRVLGAPSSYDWARFLRRQGYSIGKGTTVNPKACLMDRGMVTIGRNCSVSSATFITHSGGDRVIREAWGYEVESGRPIAIGDNCTIGANVTILYGVTVGDNCVIGAGSYVSRDVAPGTVLRPPEAQPCGTTADYVTRLARRTYERGLLTA